MSKRRSDLKIRIKFEPNRFSSEYLSKVYEQLKPVASRVVSNGPQQDEVAETKATIEGGNK